MKRTTISASARRPEDLPTGLRQRLLSVEQSCDVLGIGRTNFYGLVVAEKLSVVKIGRRTFVRVEELDRFVAALAAGPATRPNVGAAGEVR